MRTKNKGAAKASQTKRRAKPSITIPEPPQWLTINLEDEDADAWDRASLQADMLIRKYAQDILKRTAELPLDAQPEIYEMPCIPGGEWP